MGYEQLSEKDDWKLEAGNKYFFTRNHSTIVAFAIGKKYVIVPFVSMSLLFYLVDLKVENDNSNKKGNGKS